MPRPAQHGIDHLAILEDHAVRRAAGVLAAVGIEDVGELSLAPHVGRRPPERVDLLLPHAGGDRTRVGGGVGNIGRRHGTRRDRRLLVPRQGPVHGRRPPRRGRAPPPPPGPPAPPCPPGPPPPPVPF